MVVVSSGYLLEVESRPFDSRRRFLHLLLTQLSSLQARLKSRPTRSLTSLLSNTTEVYVYVVLPSAHFSYVPSALSRSFVYLSIHLSVFFTHLCYLGANSSFLHIILNPSYLQVSH